MAAPESPRISRHVRRDRWPERAARNDVSVEQAWDEAFEIQIPPHWPYGPNAKFHPPTRTILIYGPDDTSHSGMAITTVLDYDRAVEEHGELTQNSLIECRVCGWQYKPEQHRHCPWCEDYKSNVMGRF